MNSSDNTEEVSFSYYIDKDSRCYIDRDIHKDPWQIIMPLRILNSLNEDESRGTIGLILGGFIGIDKTDNKILVGSKGYGKNTIRELNEDEKTVIDELRMLGWTIVIFENMQFCKVDNNVKQNEYWIDAYCDWLVKRYSENNSKKIFVVGFSSGAYIVGLHLQHLKELKKEDSVSGYGIFSYSVSTNDAYNKTIFDKDHFKKSTLFISGSSTRDTGSNFPFVNGYHNTRTLYDSAQQSGIRHGWISINSTHNIFSKKSNNIETDKRAITMIMDDWFDKNSDIPLSDGIDELINPDSTLRSSH